MSDLFRYPLSHKKGGNHHQPVNPNQGLRMMHAPPLLSNNNTKANKTATKNNGCILGDDCKGIACNNCWSFKVKPKQLLNANQFIINTTTTNKQRTNTNRHNHKQLSDEELTVTNLRKVYSSLLEEMAPHHHEIGTDSTIRWNNSGTVTVEGSEDEGFDYSYTPDTSKKSWRLQRSLPGGTASSGGNGVTGGDWSKDGIRRYHTGGSIETTTRGGGRVGGGGGVSSTNIMNLGSFDVDVGVMDGVAVSPKKKQGKKVEGDEEDILLDHNKFSIDDDEEEGDECAEKEKGNDDTKQSSSELQEEEEEDESEGSTMEDVALESFPTTDIIDDNPASTNIPTGLKLSNNNADKNNNDKNINSSISFSPSNNMTTFESLYHLSPNMAWRLRSAYAPKSSKEQINIEILAQRSGYRADGIMKGLEVAKNCEVRVCEGLRTLGELISYCERLKGAKFSVRQSKTFRGGVGVATTSVVEESSSDEEEEDQDLEVAESMFAYFCEKNVLPMLIDSLLCHPPPLTSSDVSGDGNDAALPFTNNTTIGSSPSPFSGVTWTASVKSQILQTIAMILFNTSSPLSLTFLLSNNYMNELIMGILPLEQWKEELLEEILPPYITLLRGLVMRLRGEGSCCLPLFLCQREMRLTNNNQGAAQGEKHETYLPLLYAAVQVFCSPFGTSLRDSEGCLIRTTAMNVILNLARTHDPELRVVLVQGVGEDVTLPTTKSTPSARPPQSMLSHPLTIEQELLFLHICNSVK